MDLLEAPHYKDHVKLINKNPILFGTDNTFMATGLLECRGDKFLAFINLLTGKSYIEETYATELNGANIVGFNEVKDNNLWGTLVYACESYGLFTHKHIIECVNTLGIKPKPPDLSIQK